MGIKNKDFVLKKGTMYEKPKILRKFKEDELMPEKMELRGARPVVLSTLAYFD